MWPLPMNVLHPLYLLRRFSYNAGNYRTTHKKKLPLGDSFFYWKMYLFLFIEE